MSPSHTVNDGAVAVTDPVAITVNFVGESMTGVRPSRLLLLFGSTLSLARSFALHIVLMPYRCWMTPQIFPQKTLFLVMLSPSNVQAILTRFTCHLPPPLFTGRLGARSFTEGLTLFPSEVTSRVSSRAPGLSSRDPELSDGRHYNLSPRKLYSLFRLQLNEFFSSNTEHPCSRSHQGLAT